MSRLVGYGFLLFVSFVSVSDLIAGQALRVAVTAPLYWCGAIDLDSAMSVATFSLIQLGISG